MLYDSEDRPIRSPLNSEWQRSLWDNALLVMRDMLRSSRLPPLLYDADGHAIGSGKKIGDTIKVQRPKPFMEAADAATTDE
jgi:hypothetical protein